MQYVRSERFYSQVYVLIVNFCTFRNALYESCHSYPQQNKIKIEVEEWAEKQKEKRS